VSFTVRGDLQVTTLFIDALRTFYISPSLGGIESLILHPASMAYPDCSPEERLEVKMTDNLVRLAIGIEDADDLIADLDQGLRACMR
jgi:cystathionine gamma-synthase